MSRANISSSRAGEIPLRFKDNRERCTVVKSGKGIAANFPKGHFTLASTCHSKPSYCNRFSLYRFSGGTQKVRRALRSSIRNSGGRVRDYKNLKAVFLASPINQTPESFRAKLPENRRARKKAPDCFECFRGGHADNRCCI